MQSSVCFGIISARLVRVWGVSSGRKCIQSTLHVRFQRGSWFCSCKVFYELRVCSDNEWDHICSVAVIARGSFWWTDIDYSRSRTTNSSENSQSPWLIFLLCALFGSQWGEKKVLILTIFQQICGGHFCLVLCNRIDLHPETACRDSDEWRAFGGRLVN